jgi:hypothetical protein
MTFVNSLVEGSLITLKWLVLPPPDLNFYYEKLSLNQGINSEFFLRIGGLNLFCETLEPIIVSV